MGMYTFAARPSEDCSFSTAVVRVRASSEVRPNQSMLHRLFAWRWGESRRCHGAAWAKLVILPIGRPAPSQPASWCNPQSYRFIKLRAISVDVQVRRLTLEFVDGSIQDLSIGWLLRGSESRSMSVAGRELKGIVIEYQSGARVRGYVQVWAHE